MTQLHRQGACVTLFLLPKRAAGYHRQWTRSGEKTRCADTAGGMFLLSTCPASSLTRRCFGRSRYVIIDGGDACEEVMTMVLAMLLAKV